MQHVGLDHPAVGRRRPLAVLAGKDIVRRLLHPAQILSIVLFWPQGRLVVVADWQADVLPDLTVAAGY